MAQCSVMGVIEQVLPLETGTSQSGKQWQRQSIVIKKITNSNYEQFVCLDLVGNAIQTINPAVGMVGEFFFDADSRYYQADQNKMGRWFTSLNCYRFTPFQTTQVAQPMQMQQPQMQQSHMQQVRQGQYQQQQGAWSGNYNNDPNPFQ